MRRLAGVWSAVFILGQAVGQTTTRNTGIDAGTAAIVCAAISGVVALGVAVVNLIANRRRDNAGDEDEREEHELVRLALLVALRSHEADLDGDDVTKEEQQMLAKHVRKEMESRRRGKK